MADWYDPKTWESAAKAAATALAALSKIRDRLARKTPTRGARNLEQEVDALRTNLEQLIDLMRQIVTDHNQLFRSIIDGTSDRTERILALIGHLQKEVDIHEQRLKAIEGRRRADRTRSKSRGRPRRRK